MNTTLVFTLATVVAACLSQRLPAQDASGAALTQVVALLISTGGADRSQTQMPHPTMDAVS